MRIQIAGPMFGADYPSALISPSPPKSQSYLSKHERPTGHLQSPRRRE